VISVTPYLQIHHLGGYPSVDMAVKHRQPARQLGVFIEHPLENLMASLSFTSTVLDEGTIFFFGFWICVANLMITPSRFRVIIRV
jgi:hypothetical protein